MGKIARLGLDTSSRPSLKFPSRRRPSDRPPGPSGTLPGVARDEYDERLVDRLSRQGEEALGRLAEELVANPVVNAAITGAFDAREKAVQAQEVAMGALSIPSTADVERVTRRLRSISQRLEGVEDALDRVEERLAPLAEAGESEDDDRGPAIEARLEEIARDLAALREAVAAPEQPVPRAQERLTVGDS